LTAVAVEHGVSFERVLSALESGGHAVRRGGPHQAKAQCPAHEDREPSLSVTWSNGKTLLHCFVGCTDGTGGKRSDPSAVLAAIGLTEDDLFDEPRARSDSPGRRAPRRQPVRPRPAAAAAPRPRKKDLLGRATGRWAVTAEYIYTDEHGDPLGKVVREQRGHEHGYAKRFWQRHWTGQCTRDPCTEKRNGLTVVHESGWGKDAPARRVLYRLPDVIAAIEAGHEVWLPEGEKDADALAFHFGATGYEAAATTNASGARSWRPEYAEALRGAHVVIVEDNDPPQVNPVTGKMTEPAGRKRTRALLAALAGVAASVRVVRARTGKDAFDHLAAGHAVADFEAVALPLPPEPDEPAETGPAGDTAGSAGRDRLRLVRIGGGPGGGGGGGGGLDGDAQPNRRTRYMLRHGELVRVTTDRGGTESFDVVLGCATQIVRVDQKILDAGQAPATTGYLLRLEHPGHPGDQREISVSRKAWDSGDWLHDLPWPGVTYESSRNGIARVRDAIRTTSPATTVTAVHGAPGWIRGGDGSWLYVHAGGALGPDGPAEVAADLPSKLEHYDLPPPPGGAAELRAAASHSVGLVTALPARIGAPLAGLAYRAAVSRMGPPVTLTGPPAAYKTSMAKVALHHFAPGLPFDESVLSLSERGATGNAAAKLMHLTRDTLLLADDAAPDRSLRSAAERVASIVRLQYNGETRDRLDRDAELQRPTPPRGSLIVSAEVGPSTASAAQRTLLVPFTPGAISRDTRVELWRRESRYGRAATMASFICWQAGQRDQVLARAEELAAGYAQTWTEAGHDERTAEALAHLATGWRLMLDHLADAGAYTPAECEELWDQAWAGLDEAGRTQADPDEPADPAARILARLRTGLLGRYGHLTTPDGTAPHPDEATRYGWPVDTMPARSGIPGEQVTVVTRPHGADPIGCYADAGGERRLWLVPELALIMLRKVADRLGEPFEETVKSVSSALHQAGIGLAVTDVPSTGMLRRAAQRSMPGSIPGKRRPWVWDIPESALYEGPPGQDSGPGHDDTDDPGPGSGGAPNVSGPRFDDTGEARPGAAHGQPAAPDEKQPGPPGGTGAGTGSRPAPPPDDQQEDTAMVTDTAPGPGQLILYPALLDLAIRDGERSRSIAALRRRYCDVAQTEVSAIQPCAGCGGASSTLVGGIPLHLTCPDPAPGWQPPSPSAPAAGETPHSGAAPADGSVPAAAAGAERGAPGDRRQRAPARGQPTARERWRAPAAVLDADGIYLPGGERLRLPDGLPHAGALGDFPARLNLGWGGGKAAPSAGQLWLTASFCETIAGLPVPQAGMNAEDLGALLADAAARPWLTAAVEAGWQVSDAARARLGHRMRIWRDGNRAGAQIVFVPYISGDVALLDGDPPPAALAARLGRYAELTGVPYGRSAAYSGHDLVQWLDARRKKVLAGPAAPPPARPSGSGMVSHQRRPAPEEEGHAFVHSYDATAAWLAAAKGTELGLGEAVHRDRPEFDPQLPGLWRVRPPAWDTWRVPDPLQARRPPKDGTVWVYTPLLAFESDVLGAEIRPLEAWVWPEHTRYLDLWAQQLDAARLALAGPPPGYRPGDPDDAAVLAAVKDTYSGTITLFGSSQLAADPDKDRPAHRLYRPDWTHMIINTAAARLYRKIFAAAEKTGRWPIAIDRDNLLYTSDDADPERSCPDGLVPARPGQEKNPIGNRLGQVKNKGSARMSDAAPLLATGKFHFDDHLLGRDSWDPVNGSPRSGSQ